jgi:hypothetical protein
MKFILAASYYIFCENWSSNMALILQIFFTEYNTTVFKKSGMSTLSSYNLQDNATADYRCTITLG